VPLVQMVHENRCSVIPPTEGKELSAADVPEMLALAELTKPGPFGARTVELGTYLGLHCGGLVAMAGERLRIPGYTEISGVCTHPDHRGHGYASTLISALVGRISDRGEVPFLHVRPENKRAVELYRQHGFAERAEFHLAVLSRSQMQ
jgi:predicted GNAT family acetyltransferase